MKLLTAARLGTYQTERGQRSTAAAARMSGTNGRRLTDGLKHQARSIRRAGGSKRDWPWALVHVT